jgi:hypothetical protein
MIRHIVLLRWNDDASPDDRTQTMDAFRGLAGVVPGARDLRVGPDIAGRGTFDWSLTCDFASKDDIQAYSVHPAHRAAIDTYIKPHVQPSMEVLDFEFDGDQADRA